MLDTEASYIRCQWQVIQAIAYSLFIWCGCAHILEQIIFHTRYITKNNFKDIENVIKRNLNDANNVVTDEDLLRR